MRIHTFLHVPFEGLGSIGDWAAAGGHDVTATRWYDGDAAPEPDAYEWLIVMGGPMGVYDERQHSWLVDEKRALAAAMAAGTRVLGVCLGAQLIATVLGARVYRNAHKEIGWFPIEVTPEGTSTTAGRVLADIAPPATRPVEQAGAGAGAGARAGARAGIHQSPASSLQSPSPRSVFHWHGDTFDLPAGAVHVARSAACAQQAFSVDDRVVGLQFHLETTPASAAALIAHCPEDLAPGPYVQPATWRNIGEAQREPQPQPEP